MYRHRSLLAAGLMLAALSPLAGRAENTWNNADADFLWNSGSFNWSLPEAWLDGDDALFGPAGVGAITVASPINVHNLTFSAPGYSLAAGVLANTLTLVGVTPTITANEDVTIAASLAGTSGLTFDGPGVVTLRGDILTPNGNHYTGGTHIRNGTVILQVSNVTTSGTAYAIDGIDSLDTGATVKYYNAFDGVNNVRVLEGQIPITGGGASTKLNLTGGTLDFNGDDNLNRVPVPSGTGIILNSSELSRAVLKMNGYGDVRRFSGRIMDGGPATNSIISGKLAHRMEVDFAGGSGTLILAGSNSFSGFVRIAPGGATIQLEGEGTLGYPTTINCPGRHVIHNGGLLDLNGTSQRVGQYGGSSGGIIANNKAGTLSTLTVCVNYTNTALQTFTGKIVDNTTGSGGILALTKVGTAPQALAGGPNSYSGDTTVTSGLLQINAAGAVSPNSAIRLFTTGGTLALNYSGVALVRGLYIDGVAMPNGIYGAETAPITGAGTIQVVGNLQSALFGTDILFTWASHSKLQSQTNTIDGTWYDFPDGGTSGVYVTIDPANPAVFFRLAPLP